MNCPHCGTKLSPEMDRCARCGWKVRFSEILVQPSRVVRPTYILPASDVYYLFADEFLEPVTEPLSPGVAEEPICDRLPVCKEALGLGVCRVAFIWLAVSGHLEMRLEGKLTGLARGQAVTATPKGPYNVPVGSLECLILDSLYDRRQGFPVDEAMAKLIGFWYDGDPYDWVLRIIKQHLLASPFAHNSKQIGRSTLKQLQPQVADVRKMLDDFAFTQPGLVAALWDSIHRGLEKKRVP